MTSVPGSLRNLLMQALQTYCCPSSEGLLLGMTWPVNKNNRLFTSSKRWKISNINKQNICKKYINKKKSLWKGLIFRPQTSCINNCPHSCQFQNVPCALGFEVKH